MSFVTIHHRFQVKIASNVRSGVSVVNGTLVHNIGMHYRNDVQCYDSQTSQQSEQLGCR